MPSLSKIEVIGYVGADAEVTEDDRGVRAHFNVCVNRKFGEDEEQVWYRVFCQGSTAEFAENNVKRGTCVRVYGDHSASLYEQENDEGEVTKTYLNNQVFIRDRIDMIVWADDGEENDEPDGAPEPSQRTRAKTSRAGRRTSSASTRRRSSSSANTTRRATANSAGEAKPSSGSATRRRRSGSSSQPAVEPTTEQPADGDLEDLPWDEATD